ncbi:acetylcholine receptor subunit alpha-type acr-7-like [Rhynchophorus ferrugineus]|uniref:acetylcholine receptor subunit alpha-type acr-7-like n=1 Tax=Rhynchophorus ferrugineus TaxID=354439 RepID=UPI003FCDFA72
MYHQVVIFGVLLKLVIAVHELSCPSSSGSSTLARLRSELLCDYDSNIRSVKDHRNATVVSFRLLLKYFSFDHYTHTLSVDAWFPTYWADQHLKWRPEDYDGIKSIHLSSDYDIWTPDISIYNRKDQSTDPRTLTDTTCAVNSKGTVLCVPPVHFDALCVPNLRKYPYDVQECTVRFGSWIYKGEDLKLKLLTPMVDLEDMEPNGEWELLSFNAIYHKGNYSCCPNSTYPSIDIVFEIKRHSAAHTVNVVLPLLVCILLTLSTMAMSPLNKDRLILACVNLLAHIYHVQNLSYIVPTSGENMPSLLSISRDSTLLTGISIISTILLKSLMQKGTDTPSWVSSTVSVLVNTRPGQLILLSDNSLKGAAAAENSEDGVAIISNPGTQSTGDWTVLAKFIDVLLFTAYIIIYFILLISY